MRGFFAGSTLVTGRAPSSLLPKCGACGLFKGCKSPKMGYSGSGRKGVLIVGEFPGVTDDESGSHFTGKAGAHLDDALDSLGINMREDCWLTNALICHPEGSKIPKASRAVEFCRPNLLKTVRELKPVVVILLGPAAVQSYIGEVWKENPGAINRWVGWQIPCQKPNVWICPTFDPLHLLREQNNVLDGLFASHLSAAVAKTERPWEEVPDYESQIEVVMDTREAAAILRRMTEKGGVIAFDYENNCLKPEVEGGEIVCASACWQGKKTIVYPWHGDAIVATGEMLHSDNCQFIASNLKHEDRWTRKAFGRPVRHWIWDTMVAAHVLDNRPGICGLKFQAFVRLGAEAYDEHISQFLKEREGQKTNRVKDEVDLRQLLTYCGTDTLLEYILAADQVAQMVQHFGSNGPVPSIPASHLHSPHLLLK